RRAILFVISSRRRHTTFSRDWSSDVCSSDLGFSSHKCSTLHGIVGPQEVIEPLTRLMNEEFDRWVVKDPRKAAPEETRVIGPLKIGRASCRGGVKRAAGATQNKDSGRRRPHG